MAVSGSVDFSQTASSLIEDARRKLGVHADEEPLQAHELQTGLRTLNRMLKEWQADGIAISYLTEGMLALVASQASYDFGSGGDFATVPFEITQIRIRRNSTDLEMIEISREEYFALPNKDNTGYPTQWYYDRQRSGGTLYLWPAPDTVSSTLRFTYRRIVNDMDVTTDDLDLPQEWYDAVVYNLARKMMPEYGGAGTPDGQLVLSEAKSSYDKVRGFDIGTGKSSIMITPYSMGQ